MRQRPGIHIAHKALPGRPRGIVQCDVAALIAPVFKERWPTDATRGDFVEIVLRRHAELLDHPFLPLFDSISAACVEAYFANGGEVLHLFGVCLDDPSDLVEGPLAHPDGALLSLEEHLYANEDIALIACPWAATLPGRRESDGRLVGGADPLYHALLDHCRRFVNRFVVLDAPRHFHGEALHVWVRQFRDLYSENKAFGAVYYPWLRHGDQFVPPSGGVLGAYSRSERDHAPFGVGWSPANISLVGYIAPEVELDWFEAGELAKAAVNPLVIQPGRGLVIQGARTLTHDPTYEFINSRRIVSMISEQLRRDNAWAVFEENGPRTWKALERDILHRLNLLWRQGVLSGGTEAEEYQVWCNAQVNPKTERDAGRLNVKVRLRPVSTTEHITLDLRLGER